MSQRLIILDKVLLCQNGYSICIAKEALPAFMKKGADLGSCEADELSIYVNPNPAMTHASVYVSGITKSKAQLSVYDLNGTMKLFSEVVIGDDPTFEISLNITQLSTGVYIVKVQNNKGDSVYTKLIVL